MVLHLAAWLALAAPVYDASALLDRGPLMSVEQGPEGQFKKVTAIVRIDAPVERVWQVVTDYASLKTFMPKVIKSEAAPVEPNVTDVKLEIDAPGVNIVYTMRHERVPAAFTDTSHWVKGDLRGASWVLKLEKLADGKTLLTYAGASEHFSKVLESLDDKQGTISVGVNVSSALAAVTAWKTQSEKK